MGYYLQGSCSDSYVIWEQELGGDGRHVKITRGIPSSGRQKDFGDDSLAHDGQIVGIPPGGQLARDLRDLENQVIHPMDIVHHCGGGGLTAHM